MSKLLMLRGLPASGKSTYAEGLVKGGGNWVRVNKDLLRTMLHYDKWNGKNEEITMKSEIGLAKMLLSMDLNVVVDDTNLSNLHHASWRGCADGMFKTFEIKDFRDIDPWTCIERDKSRDKTVGRAVILNMAMQYNLVPGLKKIVVCDIDGTVANGEHRQHHLDHEPKRWGDYFAEMSKDLPRLNVYEDAMDKAVSEGAELIFVSARPEDYRQVTEDWLKYYGMDHLHLIMRPSGNKRPDTEVKQNILNKYLKHYEIIKVYDDRPSVIRMWRENGLDVEDVGYGEEF